jgi:hypothetical protein
MEKSTVAEMGIMFREVLAKDPEFLKLTKHQKTIVRLFVTYPHMLPQLKDIARNCKVKWPNFSKLLPDFKLLPVPMRKTHKPNLIKSERRTASGFSSLPTRALLTKLK